MEAYRLSEVNQYIKQVISVNFRDKIWVKAEISQIKESRGNYYLELIEKDENSQEVVARINAAIWYRSFLFIQKKLGDLLDNLLIDGTQIQCKVGIDFHEKYGLKFTIEDIDPRYTFGQLELERQKTIDKLKKEELIGKNRLVCTLPVVIKRIAVISSPGAAGLQDFERQLHDNPYLFTFQSQLFPASVQGSKLEREILGQLDEIEKRSSAFDCVIIIRGGGSKLDLSGFDSYAISKKVANYPLAVLTGIGHDIDQNVIELVAYEALKTPTAVANYLLDHNAHFEAMVQESYQKINQKSRFLIAQKKAETASLQDRIRIMSQGLVERGLQAIDNSKVLIQNKMKQSILDRKNILSMLEQKINSSDPKKILEKGYSLSYLGNKLVRSVADLKKDDALNITFRDGSVLTEVKTIKKNKK